MEESGTLILYWHKNDSNIDASEVVSGFSTVHPAAHDKIGQIFIFNLYLVGF